MNLKGFINDLTKDLGYLPIYCQGFYLQKEEKLKASSLIQIKTLLKAKNNKTNGTEIIFNIRL